MRRNLARHLAAAVVVTLAVASTAWANGEDFFAPAASDRPVRLAYTGQIRDSQTRRPVRGNIYVMITDRASGLSFPFTNDSAGHYRGPDLGAIEELGGESVTPGQLEIQVSAEGYKTQFIKTLPRKKSGLVSLDVKLERDPAFSGWASRAEDAKSGGGTWTLIGIGGVLAAIIAGLAARRLVPRQSPAS